MTKKAPTTKQIERQGIALIAQRVADMGHLWNETQNDVGIDGWIELVDPTTREATGRIILVQSKATGIPFGERSPLSFVCREEDLRYWLNGNAPVILVRSHPASREAYWVSIKDYFRANLEQRKARRIVFDPKTDRFETSGEERLWDLSRPRLDGLHLGPPPVRETLTSNLLEVEALPETVYVAPADDLSGFRDAKRRLRQAGGPVPRAWTLWGGSLYSLRDPRESSLERLTAGSPEQFDASEWSLADDPDKERLFVQLLNGAFEEQLRPAVRASRNPHVLYLTAPDDLSELELPGLGGQTRGVVRTYRREDGSLRYVRHLALERRFRRYGETWYLEIAPTYVFTADGRWESHFAADHLSGIKRREKHADVRRHVQTWTWILTGEVDLGGMAPDPEHQYLRFGSVVTVDVDSAPQGEEGTAEADAESGQTEAA